VCGTTAAESRSVLVPDVELFPGHIACDGASRSEVVVPIWGVKDGVRRVVAVIDVDCALPDGFDSVDVEALESIAKVLGEGSDW
jgi:L-methionine (R)-S-oxide reductase